MGKVNRGRKRKITTDKVSSAKKDAEHLIEFGEAHPIDDKTSKNNKWNNKSYLLILTFYSLNLDKLEDKLAKRIQDEEKQVFVVEKAKNDETSDNEGDNPDFYEQLLDVYVMVSTTCDLLMMLIYI